MSGAPSDARAWLTEADRLHEAGEVAAAAAHYREALTRDVSLFDAWYGLGCASAAIGEHGDAVVAFRGALTLSPRAARPLINLAESLFVLGRVADAVDAYERAADAAGAADPATRTMAWRNLACIAPGDPGMDNAAILAARRRWAQAEADLVRPATPAWPPGTRVRVGYVSSFFGERNWMKMFIGAINAHDRDRFEIHLIATGALPSEASGYREGRDDVVWDAGSLANAELAREITRARLDVLVDLNGYSDLGRVGLPLHRAAPVQVSWGNMYATTGIAAIDCVVGDVWTIPVEEERYCLERVRRVPETYLAFDMFYAAPDVAPPPHRRVGHVTFGSLMSAYKITDPVIAAWSSILLGVPGARLLLRNRALGQASNRADFLSRFAAHGIDRARLILEGGGDHLEFLRTYDRIDIALDAFPYNGGTSTAEALWQGVPLLTFNGDRWASRTSRSILMAAGLADWVAPDQAGFQELAIGLGRSPGGIAEIRGGLRAKIAAGPVCDTAALSRALEAIYRAEVRVAGQWVAEPGQPTA